MCIRDSYYLADVADEFWVMADGEIKGKYTAAEAKAFSVERRQTLSLRTLDLAEITVCLLYTSQTKGKGRLGRSFYSPPGSGLYMSIAFKTDFELTKSMLITTLSALAVCQAFEEVVGVGPKIKWVNDIFLNGKKVCGILTEAESNFETGSIDKIIIGIGINCFSQVFPDDIKDKATYIENPKKEFSRNQLATAIIEKIFFYINNFDRKKIIRDYKSRSIMLGQPILLYGSAFGDLPENGGSGTKARAIDIDENGGLVVEYMEGRHAREMDTITSGEITIRKDIF